MSTTPIATTMNALVLTPATRTASLRRIPIPTPGPGEVLIRIHAVSVNHVDQFYFAEPIAAQETRVLGVDFAGVVVGQHPDLADGHDRRVRAGTTVAGFVQGANSVNDRPGAFAEYVAAMYDLLWTVPHRLSFEEACTVSMCALTAAQALFPRFGLPCPFLDGYNSSLSDVVDGEEGETINILIYGSSSSLGLFAAQLVHVAAKTFPNRKFRLIGTASANKHTMLSAAPYNYDILLDYRDSTWPERVRAATGGVGIHYALDTISERNTVTKVHNTLHPKGKYHVFRGQDGGQFDTKDLAIQPLYGTVWEGLGVEVDYGDGLVFAAPPAAREFAVKFFEFLGPGVEENRVVLEPNPVRRMPGGLERIVPDAFSLLSGLVSESARKGDGEGQVAEHMRPVSGEKLVYSVA
ncbi:chaperonin 10-like protein [Aspergillus karnatakaensis]|uniref:zinc-binding alcohol dehydrogenase family protein n=1 Tax=Aspergillus karnatakaensis TaxID=1810916 RepID=UPI003CCD5ED0